MEQATKPASFLTQVRGFPANFWYANFMEILERFAFFGVRAITPLYLVASSGENGLGLDYTQKGIIYFVWALLQCMIPMVSGGYTDRYGYRISLAIAFVINIAGYIGMAQSKPIADYLLQQGWQNPGFWVFLAAACLVGTGTAIFKPPCQGTVARCVSEETSSMGWGVFYWVVNIGGALGPMCAAVIRGEVDWNLVFYGAALVTAANFIPAFTLYKEPEPVTSDDGGTEKQGIVATFLSSIGTIFSDLRLVTFLLIFSCFWLMFMQLWDLMPNFIGEWVDTSDVFGAFSWISSGWVTEGGQVKPEMIINIDSLAIIALVIPISWLVGKMHKVAAMIVGMLIAMVGLVGAGATSIGWLCCLMVFVFSIGEMYCSPTFNAYVGLIAPKDKKALYMGYANIPFAIGWAVGNLVSGFLYENMANKFRLARQYLVDQLGVDAEFVLNEKLLPKERVMEVLAHVKDGGAIDAVRQASQGFWDKLPGVDVLTKEQGQQLAASFDTVLGDQPATAAREMTQILWDLHHPYMVWVYLGTFGILGTIGMIVFYLATRSTQAPSGDEGTGA